jgi:hypothetical protein
MGHGHIPLDFGKYNEVTDIIMLSYMCAFVHALPVAVSRSVKKLRPKTTERFRA